MALPQVGLRDISSVNCSPFKISFGFNKCSLHEDVPFSQEAHQMMRTTAMNSVQIMKEIKDGSKKENIKSVYTFHVSNKI